MWLDALQKPASDEAKCPTCGGAVCRRAYGEMHAGSYVLNGERVEIRRKPNEGFADPIVLDPITVYFDGGLYRRWPSERYWSRGGKKLHRDVWELAFGKIPAGCHIHHRDANPDNNSISNLECLQAAAHLSHTWRENRGKRAPSEHFGEKARRAAAEWHGSEEGRLWHRRHAKRSQSWTKWKREQKPCFGCGTIINALVRNSGHSQKFCSQVCKASDYRKRKAASRNV